MNKQKEEIVNLLADNIEFSESPRKLILGKVVDKLAERENRNLGRSQINCLLIGAMIAFFISALVSFWLWRDDVPWPLQTLPDRPGIVIDTSLEDHSEIPDSIRQASPELERTYDSSIAFSGVYWYCFYAITYRRGFAGMDTIFKEYAYPSDAKGRHLLFSKVFDDQFQAEKWRRIHKDEIDIIFDDWIGKKRGSGKAKRREEK